MMPARPDLFSEWVAPLLPYLSSQELATFTAAHRSVAELAYLGVADVYSAGIRRHLEHLIFKAATEAWVREALKEIPNATSG